MCVVFHLLKLVLLLILNSPSRLLKDTCIVYIMSDWRVIVSTVVSILSCDPSINITSLIVVSSVESVIKIWVVVGYSPGHSLLICEVVGTYYTLCYHNYMLCTEEQTHSYYMHKYKHMWNLIIYQQKHFCLTLSCLHNKKFVGTVNNINVWTFSYIYKYCYV